MNQEQVIELARKAGGFMAEHGTAGVTNVFEMWEFYPERLQEFASLVEKATLERAAKVLDMQEYVMCSSIEMAKEIRNLAKESN